MDKLITFLSEQRQFSIEAFGPNPRLKGVHDHLRKEVAELQAAPNDLSEWADCLLLCLDGAMRAGMSPQEVVEYSGFDHAPIVAEMALRCHCDVEELGGHILELSDKVSQGKAWVDVAGKVAIAAHRQGIQFSDLLNAAADKLEINKARSWADWRTLSEDVAIEHIKE